MEILVKFGYVCPYETVKKLFPKPIAQRWGRISELEKRILSAEQWKLAISVSEVLVHKWIDMSELLGELAGPRISGEEQHESTEKTASWSAMTFIQKSLHSSSKKAKTNDKNLDGTGKAAASKTNAPSSSSKKQQQQPQKHGRSIRKNNNMFQEFCVSRA